jgi:hydroxypyruvate isomerase
MPQLAVCIEPFFCDLDYGERIKRIHEIGFKAYEFWFHDKRFDGSRLLDERKNFDLIAELNQKYGLKTADFVYNHPDGGVVAALIDRSDRNRLLDNLEEMMGLARRIGCSRFISGSGNRITGQNPEEAIQNMTEALVEIAKVCEAHNFTFLLEPFNTKVDHPDYFLDDPGICVEVLKDVGSPGVKMLFDIYHMQIMTGNVVSFIRENVAHIGHFHIAGVPGRHEPAVCELNYKFILDEIDKLGYSGYAGLEYWPTMDHEISLRQTLDHFGHR